MKKIRVIHGPNLDLLGKREPEIYGALTLDEINAQLVVKAEKLSVELEVKQSASEGELVSYIGASMGECDGIIINPAAYTHTSVAIRDALVATGLPVVEVHLSNVYKREEFRHKSYVAPIAIGQISGFGALGYQLALDALLAELNK